MNASTVEQEREQVMTLIQAPDVASESGTIGPVERERAP
jgi:hypothetical protein